MSTRLDAQNGPWGVTQRSKLGAWNHVLLHLVCVESMISRMMLHDAFIPKFVEKILPSVLLQRLSITALTLTEGTIRRTTDLHVVEDGMPQQQKVTLIGVEHVQGSPPVTPCELASSELGRAWLMG